MKVLVLGAGPAGLMAAHAAALNEDDVIICAKLARKSKMMGAQYLHAPIPLASQKPEFQISYVLQGGTAVDYRRKVYGTGWDGTTSPEDMTASHPAWDIREAYDWLWETYGSYVKSWDCERPSSVQDILDWAKADLSISTIPAPALCDKGHTFGYTPVFSSDKQMIDLFDNTVICNAAENPAWYRAAKIQGWETTEWPGDIKPPISGLFEVTKPLKNNCTCYPELRRMGRYGKWQKGILSHEAFFETAKLVTNGQRLLF